MEVVELEKVSERGLVLYILADANLPNLFVLYHYWRRVRREVVLWHNLHNFVVFVLVVMQMMEIVNFVWLDSTIGCRLR